MVDLSQKDLQKMLISLQEEVGRLSAKITTESAKASKEIITLHRYVDRLVAKTDYLEAELLRQLTMKERLLGRRNGPLLPFDTAYEADEHQQDEF